MQTIWEGVSFGCRLRGDSGTAWFKSTSDKTDRFELVARGRLYSLPLSVSSSSYSLSQKKKRKEKKMKTRKKKRPVNHRFMASSISAVFMGLVRIASWYPNFYGSHFGLPART